MESKELASKFLRFTGAVIAPCWQIVGSWVIITPFFYRPQWRGVAAVKVRQKGEKKKKKGQSEREMTRGGKWRMQFPKAWWSQAHRQPNKGRKGDKVRPRFFFFLVNPRLLTWKQAGAVAPTLTRCFPNGLNDIWITDCSRSRFTLKPLPPPSGLHKQNIMKTLRLSLQVISGEPYLFSKYEGTLFLFDLEVVFVRL